MTRTEREARYPELMEMTALWPFSTRLAGQLSGGMKQKLGLACTLVRSPDLLLLDEPTVGVDPLSRRELWEIMRQLVDDQGLTVLLSTSYLDEAERCGHAIVLHQGKVLCAGPPAELAARAAGRSFVVASAGGPDGPRACRRGCSTRRRGRRRAGGGRSASCGEERRPGAARGRTGRPRPRRRASRTAS